QPRTPCGCICLLESDRKEIQQFRITLESLPSKIRRLVFVMTIYGDGSLGQLAAGHWRLLGEDGSPLVEFPLEPGEYGRQKALIIAEVYNRSGEWRISAVGQGFTGGLGALLTHFGGEVAEEQQPPPRASNRPQRPLPPGAVRLAQPGQRHRLTLSEGDSGLLSATLLWTLPEDALNERELLELRIGLLARDGRVFAIHKEEPGSLENEPFILLEETPPVSVDGDRVQLRADLSGLFHGKAAVVFSVYLSVETERFPLANLEPVLRFETGGQMVELAYDFQSDLKANRDDVYTCVVGLAVFREGEVELTIPALCSEPESESTPWLTWGLDGQARISMNGPWVITGDARVIAEEENRANTRKWARPADSQVR
ncbi:MAG: TerD family protein, partial [Verrucomicrobiota bacterium]